MEFILKNDIKIEKNPIENGYDLFPKTEFYLTTSINRVAHIGHIDVTLLIVNTATDLAIQSFGDLIQIRSEGVISDTLINQVAIDEHNALRQAKWDEVDAEELVGENLRITIKQNNDSIISKRAEITILQEDAELNKVQIATLRNEINVLKADSYTKNTELRTSSNLIKDLHGQIQELKGLKPEKEYESKNKYDDLINILSSNSELTPDGRAWLLDQTINNHKLSYYVK